MCVCVCVCVCKPVPGINAVVDWCTVYIACDQTMSWFNNIPHSHTWATHYRLQLELDNGHCYLTLSYYCRDDLSPGFTVFTIFHSQSWRSATTVNQCKSEEEVTLSDVCYLNAHLIPALCFMTTSAAALKLVDTVFYSALRFTPGDNNHTHHCELYSEVGCPSLSVLDEKHTGFY